MKKHWLTSTSIDRDLHVEEVIDNRSLSRLTSSAEIWGVVVGSVVAAGASAYAGQQGAKAAGRGASASIAEQSRQYDQTRADFAGQRALGNAALDDIASIYGWARPSASASMSTPFGVNAGQVPTVDSTLYQSDPAYRAAWDRVLADQMKVDSRGFYHRASEHDAARVTADLNRYASEYRQANMPAGASANGSTEPSMARFFSSPDFQFRRDEGDKAINRSLASRGGLLSGAAVKEGQRFSSDLASTEFGNYINRLFTAAGIGNAATQSTAAAGANAANNNSAAILNNANTRASLYGQTAAGVNNAVQGGLQNYMLMQYLNRPTAQPVK